jgi:hypothetical protein
MALPSTTRLLNCLGFCASTNPRMDSHSLFLDTYPNPKVQNGPLLPTLTSLSVTTSPYLTMASKESYTLQPLPKLKGKETSNNDTLLSYNTWSSTTFSSVKCNVQSLVDASPNGKALIHTKALNFITDFYHPVHNTFENYS